MKLEPKHLIPYLQYDLQLYGASDIWTLCGYRKNPFPQQSDEKYLLHLCNGTTIYNDASFFEFSPILYHLSDLGKEIKHNGQKFAPKQTLAKDYGFPWIGEGYGAIEYFVEYKPDYEWRCELEQFAPFDVIQKLLEWHFDIFDLIDNGLAIDKTKKQL